MPLCHYFGYATMTRFCLCVAIWHTSRHDKLYIPKYKMINHGKLVKLWRPVLLWCNLSQFIQSSFKYRGCPISVHRLQCRVTARLSDKIAAHVNAHVSSLDNHILDVYNVNESMLPSKPVHSSAYGIYFRKYKQPLTLLTRRLVTSSPVWLYAVCKRCNYGHCGVEMAVSSDIQEVVSSGDVCVSKGVLSHFACKPVIV